MNETKPIKTPIHVEHSILVTGTLQVLGKKTIPGRREHIDIWYFTSVVRVKSIVSLEQSAAICPGFPQLDSQMLAISLMLASQRVG